jgi:hypothetical protein
VITHTYTRTGDGFPACSGRTFPVVEPDGRDAQRHVSIGRLALT